MKQREMALICALARTGSVTASAGMVGMTQPAASALLKQLEDQMGFPLFNRQNRRLSLTPDCRALLPELTHALEAIESVQRTVSGMGRRGPRRLVVGAVSAASASVLPKALRALTTKVPGISVVLRAGTATEVVDMAAKERIDLGLIYGSVVYEHLGAERLRPLGLSCVVPPRHPLARRREVDVADLARHPLIAHSRHLPVGALTAHAMEAQGIDFNPAFEVTQFSAACALVEEGCGVAVLEELSADYAQRQGLISRPLNVPTELSLTAVWPPTKGLGRAARELLNGLRNV